MTITRKKKGNAPWGKCVSHAAHEFQGKQDFQLAGVFDALKVCAAKVCPVKVGITEVGAMKVCPAKVGKPKACPAKVGPAQVNVAHVGQHKACALTVGMAHLAVLNVYAVKVGMREADTVKDGIPKGGAAVVYAVKGGSVNALGCLCHI